MKRFTPLSELRWFTLLSCLMLPTTIFCAGQVSVTTYHYDNHRTGWNNKETVLTPANVGSSSFGLILQPIALDDQVDAQPLVVPGVSITAGTHTGVHDVVYVATEHNTVYAIDVHNGTVLLSPNFGAPVPQSALPGQCSNNGPNIGITSTPVIDLSTMTLYVMTYTNDGPTYRLHALDLGSLKDKITPEIVSASHSLYPSGTVTFGAQYQRQRSALLLANGNIYAGFGSFCDKSANLSRGWLLGWQTGTLQPLASNQLFNSLEFDKPDNFFLSSIWMSGFGPAADDSGNILAVTGNSDGGLDMYTGNTDIQESVVKVSSSLTSVLDLFTPSDQFYLDQKDYDFGAGGVLALPDQPGTKPHLAVAAGKDGNMYLMNEDSLGGFSTTGNNVLGTYAIGNCWCGESYYVDPTDGLGRVVTSGGTGTPYGPATANTLEVWKVQTSPTVALTQVTSAQLGATVQDPGFFTAISSNGTANPIIWAISRPNNTTYSEPFLSAFNPDSGGTTMKQLFAGNLGNGGWWPNLGGNANTVPVVANGEVFVATDEKLQIFGLNPTTPNISFLPSHIDVRVVNPPCGGVGFFPITVSNPTAYTMTVAYSGTNGFSVTAKPAGRGNQCYGQPIAAGGSCTVNATYNSSADGTYTGSMTATGTLQPPGSGSYSATVNATLTITGPC